LVLLGFGSNYNEIGKNCILYTFLPTALLFLCFITGGKFLFYFQIEKIETWQKRERKNVKNSIFRAMAMTGLESGPGSEYGSALK
jgi:hypothetical protein